MNPSKQIIFLLVGLVIVGTLLFINKQNVESVRKDVHNKKLSPKQLLLKDSKPHIRYKSSKPLPVDLWIRGSRGTIWPFLNFYYIKIEKFY